MTNTIPAQAAGQVIALLSFGALNIEAMVPEAMGVDSGKEVISPSEDESQKSHASELGGVVEPWSEMTSCRHDDAG